MSFRLVEKYLDSVIGAGLVHVEGSTYTLSENGRAFLKRYSDYYERCLEAERFLESLSYERERLLRLCKGPRLVGSISAMH